MKNFEFRTLVIFLAITILIFFFDKHGFLEIPKAAAQSIISPIQLSFLKTYHGIQNAFSFFTFWKSGEARIKNLELKNLELQSFKQKSLDLQKENQILKDQLGASAFLKASEKSHLLPAQVLAVGDNFQIGLGQNNGVKAGQTVIFLNNFIGIISKVGAKVSFVKTSKDTNIKIPAKTGTVHGLISGEFDTSIKLSQIAKNEDIQIDDLVLTSGEGEITIPNLVIGKIDKILDHQGLFKEAKVAPLLNYDKLETVFVIIN